MMFNSLISKRDTFKKIISDFRKTVQKLTEDYERLLHKHLEAMFYESLMTIENRLTTFKQTFEILKLKLTTYSQEMPSYLNTSENADQFRSNISMVFKDLSKLKDSKLIKQMKKSINSRNTTSTIADKFSQSKEVETDVQSVTLKIMTVLSEKIFELQHSLKAPKHNTNLLQSTLEKSDSTGLSDLKNPDLFNTSSTASTIRKDINEPLLASKDSYADSVGKREDHRNDEPHRIDDRFNQAWTDPADETIESFEKEIYRCLAEELNPQNIKLNPSTLKLNPLFKSKVTLFTNQKDPKDTTPKKSDSSTEKKNPPKKNSVDESEKLKKFANSIIQKA